MEYDDIRTRYVTGDWSLRRLAEACGVEPKKLYRVSSQEKWAEQRQSWRGRNDPREASGGGLPLVRMIGERYLERMRQMVSDDAQFRLNFVKSVDGGEAVDMKSFHEFGTAYKEIARAMLDLSENKSDAEDLPGIVFIPATAPNEAEDQ